LEVSWLRPTLILVALCVLITLNIVEFRGKRKRDAVELRDLTTDNRPEFRLAHKQYLQTQNIEQVLHIVNTVLIALLVAVLSA
jgi:hypothetical protein